ncbi:MAG: hypothetical protein B6I36_06160 [Desulfobacteraceae bacterium 4572_35.1]|nr:MAG: hypothetical protein B6I36_06160 [Desulfobacteraceae bacterium 4572_35.1]
MGGKVRVIIATDDGSSRSLVWRKGRVKLLAIIGGFVAVVVVAALFFSVMSLLEMPVRRHHLVQLEATVKVLKEENQQLLAENVDLKREKQNMYGSTLSRLNERTAQLESILARVGIDVPINTGVNSLAGGDDASVAVDDGANSGGPFIAATDNNYSDSISDVNLGHTDKLLDIAKHTPLGLPSAGYFSSSFGRRVDPFNGRMAFHRGIDIAANVGTRIHATADGIVVSCGTVDGYGKMVKVANSQRFTTVFGHLQKIKVKKGAYVSRGDVIGTMGNSGRSTGPHLHYEIRDNGRAVNPYCFTFL